MPNHPRLINAILVGWKADNKMNTSASFPFRVGNRFCERKRPESERKLRLEQELLLTLMRLGLLTLDLGSRFHVSTTTVVVFSLLGSSL